MPVTGGSLQVPLVSLHRLLEAQLLCSVVLRCEAQCNGQLPTNANLDPQYKPPPVVRQSEHSSEQQQRSLSALHS